LFLKRATAGFSLLFLLSVLLWGTGCGPKGPKNSVSGKVTLNGKAVTGQVTFIGPDSKEITSAINPDGTYMIPDPPAGQAKIVVKGMPGMPAGGVPPPAGKSIDAPGATAAEMGVPPPAKYALPDNGLTFNVTGGKQTHNIELTQ
jgi:hypothetical protein